MPYCIVYGHNNDTHNASRKVSFHQLPFKTPALLKQVNSVNCSAMKCEIIMFLE